MNGASPAETQPRLTTPLAAFYFFAFSAIGFYGPYFPLWLEAHGFVGVAMSLIVALTPAMSFFGPPLVGLLSDGRGARGNLLSLACALGCSCMLGLCLAEVSGASRLFPVVFVCALGFALCRPPMILLADRISLEYGGNYGRRRVWGSVGFLLAAGGFGRWCPRELWRWLPALVAAVLAGAFVASLRLPRATGAPVTPAFGEGRRLLGNRKFVLFLGCSGTFAASHSSYDLCATLLFRDLGASGETIGLLWATGVVSEIVLLALASRLLSRGRPEVLLVVAYAFGALRWLLLSQLPSPHWAFLAQPLHALSFGLVWVSSLEVVRRSSEPHAFGSAQGLLMAANAIGGVLGILAWGPVYAARGAATVFLVAAALAVGAALLAYACLGETTHRFETLRASG